MKKYTIYESVSAGLLVVSILISGAKMSGRESLLDVREQASSTDAPVALHIDTQSLISSETNASVENSSAAELLEKSTSDEIQAEETEPEIVEIEEEAQDEAQPAEYTVQETAAAEAEQVMDESVRESEETTSEEGSSPAEPSETTVVVETVVAEEPVEEQVVPEETPAPEPAAPSINYPPEGTVEYELFILINNERAAHGLAPLSWSGSLADCAYVRASECVDCFSHTRPDGSDWYTVNPSIMYGENLATGQETAQQVFDDWMASPGHRDNILGPYTTYGSARVGNTWAQEFGY